MKTLIAFDLDGTLAASKQAMPAALAEGLADLLDRVEVAVISGGDWPQFERQLVPSLPARAARARLWLMPTSGTKLYRFSDRWTPAYAEMLTSDERRAIIAAFAASLAATGLGVERTWGETVEDRGSQITFSALGQDAPLEEKQRWDPDFAKRKVIQADLALRLPGFGINLGGTTSVDVTRKGVDKAYGLKKLSAVTGVALDAMIFVGDAVFPGGNDYPPKTLGVDTIRVRDPEESLTVITTIIACLGGGAGG